MKDTLAGEEVFTFGTIEELGVDFNPPKVPFMKSESFEYRLLDDNVEIIRADSKLLESLFCCSRVSSESSQNVDVNVSSDDNRHCVSSSSRELGIFITI